MHVVTCRQWQRVVVSMADAVLVHGGERRRRTQKLLSRECLADAFWQVSELGNQIFGRWGYELVIWYTHAL